MKLNDEWVSGTMNKKYDTEINDIESLGLSLLLSSSSSFISLIALKNTHELLKIIHLSKL